jgi:hypothetical protein
MHLVSELLSLYFIRFDFFCHACSNEGLLELWITLLSVLNYHFSLFQPSHTTPHGRGGKFKFYIVSLDIIIMFHVFGYSCIHIIHYYDHSFKAKGFVNFLILNL